MTTFFQQQLDYIFFFYGLAFILLAAVCLTMHRTPGRRIPWLWLGLFGLAHGVGEWLDLIALSVGDDTTFKLVRMLLMASSFFFLTEFARRGMWKIRGTGAGAWIYLPLIAVSLSGSLDSSLNGVNATTRYSLGLAGGLAAGWLLLQTSKMAGKGSGMLKFSAALITLYGIATGVIVPPADFPPASLLNTGSFMDMFGVPMQLLRGVLAISLTSGIWTYYRQSKNEAINENEIRAGSVYEFRLSALFVVILVVGWLATEQTSHHSEEMMQTDLLNQAAVAAEAISPGRIESLVRNDTAALAGGDDDRTRLAEQISGMKGANKDILGLALFYVASDGSIRKLVDASGYPGRAGNAKIDDETAEALRLTIENGTAMTTQSVTSKDSYYSGFYPVMKDGQILAVVKMDIDTGSWRHVTAMYRLAAISMTLLISMIAIGGFITRQSWLEYARRIWSSEAKLSEAQRLASLGSWSYDVASTEVVCSEEMSRIIGNESGVYSYDEFVRFIHPEDHELLDTVVSNPETCDSSGESELRFVTPAGTVHHVAVRFQGRRSANGDVVQVLGTAQDITERKRMEDALRQSEQRLRMHVDRTPLAVIEWDTDFLVTSWNPAAERMFGYSRDEAVGRRGTFIFKGGARPVSDEVLNGKCGEINTFENQTREGRMIVCNWYNTPLTTGSGDVIGFASLAEDITEKIKAEKELTELSLKDDLTGLNNRRGFMTLATQQIKNAIRFNQKAVLFYADMDGLKTINDTHGHAAGDDALCELAAIMGQSFRSADVTGRLGGDEFVALTLETADQDADTIAVRFEENIIAHNMHSRKPYKIAVSFGLTRFDSENPVSLEGLLENGDRLMYADKLRKKRRSA